MHRFVTAFSIAVPFLLSPVLVFAASTTVKPETGSLALLSLGLISVVLIRRRQG